MLRSIQRAFNLMRPDQRRQVVKLVPLMLLASMGDVVTVLAASTFFGFLSGSADLPPWLASFRVAYGETTFSIAAATSLLGIVLLTNAIIVSSIYQVNRHGWTQLTHFSETSLNGVLHQPYAWFLNRNSSKVKQELLIETQRVVTVLIVQSMQVIARSLGAVTIVAWLLYQAPALTAFLAVTLSMLYGGMHITIKRVMSRYGSRRSKSDRERHLLLEESLVGVKELKLLGLEDRAIEQFRKSNERYADSMVTINTVQVLTKPALEVVGITGLTLLVSAFVLTGQPLNSALALLGTYAMAAYRLLPTVQLLLTTSMRVQVEHESLNIVEAHIRSAPEQTRQLETKLTFDSEIVAKGVRFTYPQSETSILHGLDLQFPKGSWTAFVGTTGSGKSTLADILMGLLSPTEGSIQIDGYELRTEADMRAWQALIGYVPQALFMSDASIAQNIALIDREPDLARVEKAAEIACATEFIQNTEHGLHTGVGERGVRVSGGQRQRIGIARSIYRKPSFLVLDEATSALDNTTESQVMEGLRTECADTTVLMIAHRLSTTRHCDNIVVLERGRIVEQGSYDDLMAKSPRFQSMVNASLDEE